jgi:hypothetical protein
MVDVADVGDAAAAAGEQTIKIPSNVMGWLRQSYDSREKILDWSLAFIVAGLMVYTFRGPLLGMVWSIDDPNAGKADNPQPNMDVGDAFPNTGATSRIYTYNMPPSRDIRSDAGPSGTGVPRNPSRPPEYDRRI